MNKTITVNIGGYAFTMEETAFQELQNYLKSIENHFSTEESGDEILSDIETRIAELFNELLKDGRQVVESTDVAYVKQIMGEPEQYDSDEETTEEPISSEKAKSSNKKFFRDVDDAIFGGVCSGLSHYLGWDPIWLRGLFIVSVLAGLAGIPVYLILWILIPAAKTTSERLKMKGRSINVENISKTIKEEVGNVSDSVKDFGARAGEETKRISKKTVPKVVDSLEQAGGLIGKVLRILFGVILLIVGFVMIIGLVGGVVTFNAATPVGDSINFGFLRDFIFLDSGILTMSTIAIFLLIGIPMVAIIYMGIRLLTKLKPRAKGIGLTLFVLFFAGILLAAISGIVQGTKYNHGAEVIENYPIENDSLLSIRVSDDPYFNKRLKRYQTTHAELMALDENRIVYGFPELKIKHTNQDKPRLEIEKTARGSSYRNALEISEDIEYHFTQNGDTLSLAPYFTGDESFKYRDHYVRLTLYVPDSTSIKLDEDIARIMERRYAYDGIYITDMAGKTATMIDENLECQECE